MNFKKGDEVVAKIFWSNPETPVVFITTVLAANEAPGMISRYKIAREGGDPLWVSDGALSTPEQAVREGLCF
jgi:hypothetical protein